MKNENGITLISLAATIVILIILASVTTYTGVSSIRSSKLTKFKQELELVQAQVDMLYEKYKDDKNMYKQLGSGLTTSQLSAAITAGADQSQINNYRLFTPQILESYDLMGIERNYIVNIATRDVRSLTGYQYEGRLYYSLQDLTGQNNKYNGLTDTERGDVTFNYSTSIAEDKFKVTVSDIVFSKYVGKGVLRYKDNTTGIWTTVEENLTKEKTTYSFILPTGSYVIQVKDAADKTAEVTVNLGN